MSKVTGNLTPPILLPYSCQCLLQRKKPTLREKCPNMEFFLVCIFPDSGWIRSPNPAKYRPEKTPYLDTLYTAQSIGNKISGNIYAKKILEVISCRMYRSVSSKPNLCVFNNIINANMATYIRSVISQIKKNVTFGRRDEK